VAPRAASPALPQGHQSISRTSCGRRSPDLSRRSRCERDRTWRSRMCECRSRMVPERRATDASLNRILGNAVAGRQRAGRARTNKLSPSAAQNLDVQPTLVVQERTKRRGGLSKLISSCTPRKGSGKTQNVASLLDQVRCSAARIERRPEVGMRRQFAIPGLRRILWS
jgi:hypothetical protein